MTNVISSWVILWFMCYDHRILQNNNECIFLCYYQLSYRFMAFYSMGISVITVDDKVCR